MNSQLSILLAVVAASLAHAVPAQVGIRALGDLPGGVVISGGNAASADGRVIVGSSTVAGGESATFRWTQETGMEQLPGVPGGSFYSPIDISLSSEFVVGNYTRPGGGGPLGYIWSESMGTVSFGGLIDGDEFSVATAVSDNGVAVGHSAIGRTTNNARIFQAARWTAGTGIEALPYPTPEDAEFSTTALDILADDRILINAASGRWLYSDATGFEQLPVPNYFQTINSDGSLMIGNVPTASDTVFARAAYWTPDTGEVILEPFIQGTTYSVTATSDDGSVMVGGQTDVGTLLWFDRGPPVTLDDYAAQIGIDLTGWSFLQILDISADGTTLVGTGRRDEWEGGRLEAIVITIPAPGTIPLAALGLLAMRRRRREV